MPDSTETRIAAATGFVKQKAYSKAIPLLKAIRKDEPENEIALGMLAAVHAEIGMRELAIEEYRGVLGINPANHLARFQLGLMQFIDDQPEEALDSWKPMLEIEQEFMANYHGALALIQLARPDEAAPLLERARSNMPQDHPLRPDLMRVLEQ